jgi:rhamnosyltransferase subunit B
MRFLIVTLGSLGDLLPFLSITKELVARGHEVSIAGSSNFEPFVKGIGVEFTSVLASDRIQRPAEDARLWDVGRIWALGMERVLAPAMRPTYELIRDRTRHDSCIVLARWAVFGARLAAEKLGIPLCTVYMSAEALNVCDPSSTASRSRGISGDDVFGPAINAYRDELGLRPVKQICESWLHSPRHGLGLFPDWFCTRQPCWPPQVTTTGFVTYDDVLEPAPVEALEAFLQAGDPPIVFTPGTGMPRAGDFFRVSLAVCASLGMRAIFLTLHHAHLPPPSTSVGTARQLYSHERLPRPHSRSRVPWGHWNMCPGDTSWGAAAPRPNSRRSVRQYASDRGSRPRCPRTNEGIRGRARHEEVD